MEKMMSKNDLTAMIDNLVLERTMSLEAIESVRAIKEKAEAMTQRIAHLEDGIKSRDHDNEQIRAELMRNSDLLDKKSKECHELKAMISEAQVVKNQGKCAMAKLEGFTEAMAMVFKPSVVKESIQRNVAVPVQGGGNCSGFVTQGTETETVTRSQE